MPRSKELSMELKGQIIGMASCGKSARQISRELALAHSIKKRIELVKKGKGHPSKY